MTELAETTGPTVVPGRFADEVEICERVATMEAELVAGVLVMVELSDAFSWMDSGKVPSDGGTGAVSEST